MVNPRNFVTNWHCYGYTFSLKSLFFIYLKFSEACQVVITLVEYKHVVILCTERHRIKIITDSAKNKFYYKIQYYYSTKTEPIKKRWAGASKLGRHQFQKCWHRFVNNKLEKNAIYFWWQNKKKKAPTIARDSDIWLADMRTDPGNQGLVWLLINNNPLLDDLGLKCVFACIVNFWLGINAPDNLSSALGHYPLFLTAVCIKVYRWCE